MTNDQAVDFTIQAAVAGASTLGFSVPPEAVPVLKDLITCGVGGGSAVDCAKQAVVNAALKDAPDAVKGVAGCLVGGADALACAQKAGLDQVPAQARPVVDCLLKGGNVGSCAPQVAVGEAIAHAPPEVRQLALCMAEGGTQTACGVQAALADANIPDPAKQLVQCIANNTPAATCAARGAQQIDPAMQQAMQQIYQSINDLNPDAPASIDKYQKRSVQDIITLAQGIAEGDFGKILTGAAPELAKIAITIVIQALVPVPGVAAIVGPVVSGMINFDAALGTEFMQDLKNGDIDKVAQLMFDAYFLYFTVAPCSLLPHGGFRDATCGNIAKVIVAAGDVVGGVAGWMLDQIESLLKTVGLWQPAGTVIAWIGGAFEDGWHALFGGGLQDPAKCGSVNDYYANNYFACLGAAANSSNSPEGKLHDNCVGWFQGCYGGDAGKICDAMNTAFDQQVNAARTAADQAGLTFTPAVGAYIYSHRAALCTNGRENSIKNVGDDLNQPAFTNDFLKQCIKAVNAKLPLNNNSCGIQPQPQFGYQRDGAANTACTKAIQNSNWSQIAGDTCEAYCWENGCAPTPPQACWWTYYPADQVQPGPYSPTVTIQAYGRSYSFVGILSDNCPHPTYPHWRDKFHWGEEVFGPKVNPGDPVARILPGVNPNWGDIFGNMDPGWSAHKTLGPNNILPQLVVGNCQVARTVYNPVATWTSNVNALRSSATSAAERSALLGPRIAPPQNLERLSLSLQPISLATGSIESCSGVGALASRSSSGADGSYSPKTTLGPKSGSGGAAAFRSSSGSDRVYGNTPSDTRLKQQSGSGGAAALRSSSGYDTVKSSSNPAMDRLSGEGMSAAVPNSYIPDGSRVPGARAGATSVQRPPTSSSGISTVKSGGVAVPRQPTSSSGISTVQSSGVSVPRQPTSSSGISTVKSGGAAVFRPPPAQPSCDFGNCPR